MIVLILLFNISILVLTLVHCSAGSPRPTENRRRRIDRNPKIDNDFRRQYMPLLPEWDSQLPEVLEESVSVQAKVRAEDGRESVIENI